MIVDNYGEVIHEINDQISREELTDYINSRSDKVSTGPTKLKIGVIRALDTPGLSAILALLNACLLTGTVPIS